VELPGLEERGFGKAKRCISLIGISSGLTLEEGTYKKNPFVGKV